jgi:hypothetical protein
MSVNIGQILKHHCHHHLIKPEALARILNVHPVTIYNIFKQRDMRSTSLLHVSKELKHDFFRYYQQELDDDPYKRIKHLTEVNQQLADENKRLKDEIAFIQKYLSPPKP